MNPSRPSLADLVARRKAEHETAQRVRNRSRQQGRYERWHVPDTPEREQDGWLTTYMDLITLLLVLFIAMLALSRVDLRPMGERLPPELVGALTTERLPPAGTELPPDLPRIPASWALLPEAPLAPPSPPSPAGATPTGAAPIGTAPADTVPVDAAPTGAAPADAAPDATPAGAEPAAAAPAPAPMPTAEELGLTDLGDAVDVIVNSQSVSFRISNELLFPSGQALLNPGGLEVIEKLAAVIKRSDYPVSVEGHSDPVPIQTRQFPSNWELSSSRATAVLRELVRSGVAASRLRAVGYADTQPLESNDTPAGRAANRRVELIMRIVPAP